MLTLQATPTLWDQALSQSKYNGINLDLGHYTAGTNSSPIPFLKKNHGRITSMHMKDRKYEIHGGENMPWGQGDTPIKEALQLMKQEHYLFPADHRAGVQNSGGIERDGGDAEVHPILQGRSGIVGAQTAVAAGH